VAFFPDFCCGPFQRAAGAFPFPCLLFAVLLLVSESLSASSELFPFAPLCSLLPYNESATEKLPSTEPPGLCKRGVGKAMGLV